MENALRVEKGLPSGLCPESPGICPPVKYRDYRGYCNNVRYPEAGSKGTAFLRLMTSSYKDGKSLLNNLLFILSREITQVKCKRKKTSFSL